VDSSALPIRRKGSAPNWASYLTIYEAHDLCAGHGGAPRPRRCCITNTCFLGGARRGHRPPWPNGPAGHHHSAGLLLLMTSANASTTSVRQCRVAIMSSKASHALCRYAGRGWPATPSDAVGGPAIVLTGRGPRRLSYRPSHACRAWHLSASRGTRTSRPRSLEIFNCHSHCSSSSVGDP
jgi:hypothetical protein